MQRHFFKVTFFLLESILQSFLKYNTQEIDDRIHLNNFHCIYTNS